jgi:hypothetical protein
MYIRMNNTMNHLINNPMNRPKITLFPRKIIYGVFHNLFGVIVSAVKTFGFFYRKTIIFFGKPKKKKTIADTISDTIAGIETAAENAAIHAAEVIVVTGMETIAQNAAEAAITNVEETVSETVDCVTDAINNVIGSVKKRVTIVEVGIEPVDNETYLEYLYNHRCCRR